MIWGNYMEEKLMKALFSYKAKILNLWIYTIGIFESDETIEINTKKIKKKFFYRWRFSEWINFYETLFSNVLDYVHN